ncbi:MAG: hypothetical protein ACRER1_06780 [Gammaproteobacteria bacterium]
MTVTRLAAFAGLAVCGLAFAGPAGAAPQCPHQVDVRNLMTVTEFDRAGLDKLDKQQLAALNAWLSRYLQSLCTTQAGSDTKAGASTPPPPVPGIKAAPAGQASPPVQTTPPVKSPGHTTTPGPSSAELAAFGSPPQKIKEPGRIESRLVGEFHGWSGDTIFRLENGQVWKQAGPGYFRTDLKNPQVTIKKLLFGYVMVVKGYESKEIFVRRIQ